MFDINRFGILAMFRSEMMRFRRRWVSGVISPVLTVSLYFVIFGAALGSGIGAAEGVPYRQFIVPGLILFTVITQSISNAAFATYMMRFTGTIFEPLSAPMSAGEITIGLVGAAALQSIIVSLAALLVAGVMLGFPVEHPILMLIYLTITAVAFSIAGVLIGLVCRGFEQVQLVPSLIVGPFTLLGGAFFSVESLQGHWSLAANLNPFTHLIAGFRMTFFSSDVAESTRNASLLFLFGLVALLTVHLMFVGGRNLRS